MITVVDIKHKPALLFLIAFGVGIAASNSLAGDDLLTMRVSFLCVILLGVLLLRCIRGSHYAYAVGVLLLLAAASGILFHSSRETSFRHSVLNRLATFSDRDAIIYGRVASHIRSTSNITSIIDCDSVRIDSFVIRCNERLGLQMFRDPDSIPKVGQYIQVFGSPEEIVSARNPYESQYTERLRRTYNIAALVYSKSEYDVVVIDSLPTLAFTDHIAAFADRSRTHISRSITSIINDPTTSAYVQAMLLGERRSLPPESWQEFQRAGLSHILVVSGFNLSLIAAAFYYLLCFVRMRQRTLRIVLSMLVAGCYAILIGPEPSMLRAAIVIVLFLLAKLTERKTDLVNLTSAAACINLIINPNELFDIGFQLSYGAVFSLAIIAPRLDRSFEQPLAEEDGNTQPVFFSSLKAIAIGTAAVFMGTLPILAYHFHQISLIGLLANIIAIPISGIITILGIILVPLGFISSWVASLYGEALQFFVRCLTLITGSASDFRYSIISVARPALWTIILYYAAIGYILFSEARKTLYKKCVISAAFLLMLFLLGIPLAHSVTNAHGALTMTFFDVGQGDGILISTPNGKEYMIDVGGISQRGFTPAARSIIPFLKAEGISSIDALFITHMHADHYGGASKLALEGYIEGVYTCGEKTTSLLARTLDSIRMAHSIPVTTLRAGNIITLDENISLYVLNPEGATSAGTGSQANHRSLALKLVYGNTSTLFLGDIEGVDEKRLAHKNGEFLRSDIVKVAHHGSKTSSTAELIQTANPEYAVISVGRNNKFGHPSDEVIRRWFSSGTTICRTDKDGAVIFRSDGKHVERVHWKN